MTARIFPDRDCRRLRSAATSDRLEDARNEARPHLRAAGIAAGGVEGEARNRLAVADDVGDDGDHRGGHLGEVEAGILQIGLQRDRGFADVAVSARPHPLMRNIAERRPSDPPRPAAQKESDRTGQTVDVGVLDDLAPFGDLHLDPGGELLGGVGDRFRQTQSSGFARPAARRCRRPRGAKGR